MLCSYRDSDPGEGRLRGDPPSPQGPGRTCRSSAQRVPPTRTRSSRQSPDSAGDGRTAPRAPGGRGPASGERPRRGTPLRLVLDAAAVGDWLLRTPGRADDLDALLLGADDLHSADLLDVEVLSILRRKTHRRELSARRSEEALDDLESLPILRHATAVLVRRIWTLRDAITAYDAAYVALAEALDAPLLTTDRRLARSTGHGARIVTTPGG
jgi:predicted nucleic acid-binding protein